MPPNLVGTKPVSKLLQRHVVLAAISLLAGVLRVHALDRGLKPFDEFIATFAASGGRLLPFTTFTSDQVFGGLRETFVTTNTTEAGNAQFYNLILHLWILLVGRGDAATRSLSIAFGTATVVCLFFLVLELTESRSTAWVASLLLAIHPAHITLSSMTRSYALATLIVVLFSLVYSRLLLGHTRTTGLTGLILLYDALVVVAALTHYLTLYVFLGQAALALYAWRRHPGRLLLLAGPVLVGLLTWLLFCGGADGLATMAARSGLWSERAHSGRGWVQVATGSTIVRSIIAQCVQYFGVEVAWKILAAGVRARLVVPVLAVPALLTVAAFAVRGQWRRPLRAPFVALMAAMPVLFSASSAFASRHTVGFLIQYSIFGVPFVCAILAVGMLASSSRAWRGLGCIMVLVVAAGLPEAHRPANPFVEVSAKILGLYRPGDVVVYPDPDIALFNTLYLKTATTVAQQSNAALAGGDQIVLLRPDGTRVVLLRLQDTGIPRPLFVR